MDIDVDGELQKAEDVMKDAKSALLASGFTEEQLENLSRYVRAGIAHSHYAVAKANREIKSESACDPGTFQLRVL